MNPIDDLFRDGLEGRSGEVPDDMWARINAGEIPVAPEGAEVDKFFAAKLADRAGEVPPDMWARIAAGAAATPLPEGAALDQVFAEGLKHRTAAIPAGMWARIWSSASPPATAVTGRRRVLAAGLVLFLLLLGGLAWQQFKEGGTPTPALDTSAPATVAVTTPDAARAAVTGQAEGESQEGGTTSGQNDSPAIRTAGAAISPETLSAAGSPRGIKEAGGPLADNTLATQLVGGIPKSKAAGLSNSPVAETAPVGTEEATVVPTDFVVSDQNLPAALPTLPRETAIAALPLPVTPLRLKRSTKIQPLADGFVRVSPRHRFQTELLFGAAYARQEFTALTPDQNFLREVRETSEFPDLSYQVSLRGSYKLSDRLLVLGGLTYAEIRNEFEHEPIINGQPQLVRTTNRIRQLEAPLLLGIRLPGQRLSVSLNAGPVVNLTTSAQGRFLDPDAPQTRDLATDGNYRRNTGVGFMTSLSTTYKIGKKEPFLLLVEPFFKAYPGSFTVKGAPLKEKYWVAGLQLGVRRSF